MVDDYIHETADGVILRVYAQPRASKTAYVGPHGEKGLKFTLAAPPVEGEANEMLCAFLAKQLQLPKGAVIMISGSGSRHKRIRLTGISIEKVKQYFRKWK
ncbi:MAG: DUF167 family protein [Nitrospirales bacterium]|nr:DUF167 domain-containing protein [Nitrospira sp.]MDR4501546.1 DUF167 family protein [Nitrospirales bacterium]